MIDDNFLNEYGNILYQTEKPSRYIGDEFGSYDKDFNLVDGKFHGSISLRFHFPAAATVTRNMPYYITDLPLLTEKLEKTCMFALAKK